MDSNHGAVVMAGDLYPNQGNNVGENGNNEEPNEESNNDEANEEEAAKKNRLLRF